MKIGIITFHFVKNYGAALQCYALSTFLKKQGHEAEIIDYRPEYHTMRFAAHKPPLKYAMWRYRFFKDRSFFERVSAFKKGYAAAVKANREHTDDKVLRAFEDFRRDNFCLTRRYGTLKQIKKDPPKADAYITGSDQLWNPDLLTGRFDPAYFLDFGDEKTKRVAYAVSTGRDLSGKELKRFSHLCENLDAVSLRESSSAAKDAIKRKLHVCIDPAFLPTAEDYAAAEGENTETEPYIFLFGHQTNDNILAAIEKAKEKYGVRVINGSPDKVIYKDAEAVYDFGPDRFLTYIKNADCVVTNSFHTTVFSIIYKKDFISVRHTRRPKRAEELLKKLGVTYRLYENEDFSFDRPIDYEAVEKNIQNQRKAASEYLSTALDKGRE